MSQQQVLAPQMQQSLAILQAPLLELRTLIEQELEQNPVLEEVAAPPPQDETNIPLIKKDDPTEPPPDVYYDSAIEKPNSKPVDDFQAEFEKLAKLDQEWKEHFTETNVPLRTQDVDEEKRQFLFDSLTSETSLSEFLMEQVRLSDLPREKWQIAEMIIGNIDENGYLKITLDELAYTTNIPSEQIEEVLKVIHTFHPPGVGARNLRECLLIQLEQAGKKDSLEYKIVQDHLEALAKHKFPEIAKKLNVEIDDVQEAAEKISRLEPKPGRIFMPDNDIYVVPEVFVQKIGDDFVVTLNNEYIPHLKISNIYKDLMADPNASPQDKDYIRAKITAGKNFIKSIHHRQQTILNIAKEIVNRQREFMEKGVAHLKPLTMAEIARAVGVHETTVSRTVSGKYMQTPQGVFEMKYFFSSGVQSSTGTQVSNKTVKEMIAELFKKEDPTNPLSDQDIVRMLAEKGIVIARRTVAKYRSELKILPSNLRKVY
ncbi:MAG: RNA polymerase factor sigma-54 [Verrucomicrobiae bacterium]|nr:RNA polymerase factor sigma-54 [Verrucomicrobiae bacterium]